MTHTRKSSPRSGRAAVIALCLACTAAAQGDSLTPAQRELREREIANKSEAERARLQRNFRIFRELPADEQKKLRLLDLELKEDARNQGSLRTVMNEYYDWLASPSLTPGQRQELRDERDPNRREMLVRELLKEQQEQALASGSARGFRIQELSATDLAAALDVIEKVMRESNLLSPDELRQLQSKKGVARHAYLMELAFRRGPGMAPGPFPWNSPAVFDAIVESISNERQRKHILEPSKDGEKRMRLNWALMGGFGAEYEKKKPAREELEKFFVQLKSHEQDEIMRLPYDQQQQQLTRMFMTKKAIDDPDNYPRPPQTPLWMRGQRAGGFRAPGAPRPGDDQRGANRGAVRKIDGTAKKAQKDRKQPPTTDEPE